MYKTFRLSIMFVAIGTLLINLIGCGKSEEEVPSGSVSLNSFTMELDGKKWMPFGYESDPCNSEYIGWWSSYNDIPYYTIIASNYIEDIDGNYSETRLSFQIMDVMGPGIFPITGKYPTGSDNYALFIVNNTIDSQEEQKRYVNSTEENSFFVQVDEVFSVDYSTLLEGISGTFHGTLFNDEDPKDFITIKKGKYRFELLNHPATPHCKR